MMCRKRYNGYGDYTCSVLIDDLGSATIMKEVQAMTLTVIERNCGYSLSTFLE